MPGPRSAGFHSLFFACLTLLGCASSQPAAPLPAAGRASRARAASVPQPSTSASAVGPATAVTDASATTAATGANVAAATTSPAPGEAVAVPSEQLEPPTLEICDDAQFDDERGAFIKGQVHAHTSRSFDAATPVDKVISFYARRGYDFLALTDHNHITITKDAPSSITMISAVELTYNAQSCDPPAPLGGVCALHSSVLFLNPLRDATGGRHFTFPFRRSRKQALMLQLTKSQDLEGLFVINHPTYQQGIDASLLDYFLSEGVRHVEFFNAGVIRRGKKGQEAEIEQAEELWDAMLTRGHRVLALGGDDAHQYPENFPDAVNSAGQVVLSGDHVWLMVRAAKEPDAIRRAIEAGDYYVSSGPELRTLRRETNRLCVRVQEQEGRGYSVHFVGSGGYILGQVEGPSACYRPQGDEGYVRAVVRSDDGKRVWTQPLFVGAQQVP